ncbi:short-chain dehydrogenase [Pochonia chlamydosporia 170]|uniref:Short-chain dehydrogenase n=1 Tax=Pochonia chlamydosporia 170 TaxID=1380566 RepID=A0A179FGR6_METCM|nr:short-chain dehydrogenase [Pochonia chlamydosporia 170]OAQ64726.1 short-chain dehydrogenase [Pochonia chlamydosporia 170]
MAQMFSRGTFTQSFLIPKPVLTEENLPDQTGKVHLVTGGYTGLGKELTSILYRHNATIYVAGRSEDKAATAIADITAKNPESTGRLEFLHLDLSDLTTIKPAVDKFIANEKRLDVLVNNAGVMMCPKGSKGKQGHELQLVTNCLGPFLFTKGLVPILKETAITSPPGSVRVIWASSLVANLLSPTGGVKLGEDDAPQISSFQPTNYGQSKAANNFYAAEFSRRYGGDGILSVAFNPGNLATELQRHLDPVNLLTAKLINHPARFGAYTELYAGWSPDITVEDGGMFVIPWGRKGNDILRNDLRKAIEESKTDENSVPRRFWEWSDRETSQYA